MNVLASDVAKQLGAIESYEHQSQICIFSNRPLVRGSMVRLIRQLFPKEDLGILVVPLWTTDDADSYRCHKYKNDARPTIRILQFPLALTEGRFRVRNLDQRA